MIQTVGILLDDAAFRGIPLRRTGHERLDHYNRSARKLRMKPFYMNLRHTGSRYARGYSSESKGYQLKRMPLPKVVHNRDMALRPAAKQKLSRLAGSSYVFNRTNRVSKYRVHRILAQNAALLPHLPRTMPYTSSNLAKAMKQWDIIFIKPVSSSVGDGIIKLSRTREGMWKIYSKRGKPQPATRARAAAYAEKLTRSRPYLVQEGIALATVGGRPFDIRVSVQRNSTGKWQITGMVGKVAAAGHYVTNVAKGGRVKPCTPLFQAAGLRPEAVRRELARVSLLIAEQLSRHLPHMADLGLDMGVDRAGRVKFIEMNGRDQRYSFKKAGMKQVFYQTYATPMAYARRLLDRH